MGRRGVIAVVIVVHLVIRSVRGETRRGMAPVAAVVVVVVVVLVVVVVVSSPVYTALYLSTRAVRAYSLRSLRVPDR